MAVPWDAPTSAASVVFDVFRHLADAHLHLFFSLQPHGGQLQPLVKASLNNGFGLGVLRFPMSILPSSYHLRLINTATVVARHDEIAAGGAGSGGRGAGRGGTTTVPTHAGLYGVCRRGVGGGLGFLLSFFCPSRPLGIVSFCNFLGAHHIFLG